MGNPAMAWGIYFDAGSSEMLVENNIVYHTLTGGIMGTCATGNVVRNNIFALSAWQAAWRWSLPNKTPPPLMERNIFYLTQGDLFHADGGQGDVTPTWDHNLYWRTDGQPLCSTATSSPIGRRKGWTGTGWWPIRSSSTRRTAIFRSNPARRR